MDLSRLSLKPYKSFAFKPSISFDKEYQNQASYSPEESLLVASSFFYKKKWTSVDPFRGQALFLWNTFPPLKCFFHITKLLTFSCAFYASDITSFLTLLTPLRTFSCSNIVSDTKGRRHTVFNVWVNHRFLFAFLTANDCLLMNPLLLDTTKSFYHHWIWNYKWLWIF